MNALTVSRSADQAGWCSGRETALKDIIPPDSAGAQSTSTTRPSAQPTLKLKKILVPIDFSRQSRKALHYACSFASIFGASVTLLYYLVPGHDLDDSDAHLILQKVVQEEGIDPALIEETVVSTGVAASHDIIRTARDVNADLVIISTHLYAGIMHTLFGRATTTTDLVALDAPCPVLIIHDGGHDFISE